MTYREFSLFFDISMNLRPADIWFSGKYPKFWFGKIPSRFKPNLQNSKVSYCVSTSNKFSPPPNFTIRHEVHNFQQAEFLYICLCNRQSKNSCDIRFIYVKL